MAMDQMQETAKALFEYIKELCQLKQQTVLDVQKQQGYVFLQRIAKPEYVRISGRDTVSEETEDEDALVVFHKPEFQTCPKPDPALIEWLNPGWDDYRYPLEHKIKIEKVIDEDAQVQSDDNTNLSEANTDSETTESEIDDEDEEKTETTDRQVEYIFFEESADRVVSYEAWEIQRGEWAKEQKIIRDLRDAFVNLFDMYNQVRQYPDTLEFMVGNGQLTDRNNREINHPVYLKRLKIDLDAVNNTLYIYDTDEPGRMYLPMFSVMDDINSDIIRELEKNAAEQNIHPLDHNDGEDFLKSIAHQLCTSNCYIGPEETFSGSDERIVIRWNPVFFLCKKPDGTVKALQSILNAIENGASIPKSLITILGGNPEEYGDGVRAEGNSDANDVTSFGYSEYEDIETMPLEDENILLPKPANREQMQIVRRIEHENAVLVQGPPGTGKTHTIANLLGHFLAQGKSVLVTSHTSKALAVLKEKVPATLQALCVAMLDDNRADMENSINEIIERTSIVGLPVQKRNIEGKSEERHKTLLELEKARKLVYSIRHKEFEPIIYRGDSYSPREAAEFVAEHEEQMRFIPGVIDFDAPFPLDENELERLYYTNESITAREEEEIQSGLPDVNALISPALLEESNDYRARLSERLSVLNMTGNMHLEWQEDHYAVVDTYTAQAYISIGDPNSLKAISDMLSVFREEIPSWAVRAIADGAENGFGRNKWSRLIQEIDDTYKKSQSVIEIILRCPIELHTPDYESLKGIYSELFEMAEKHHGHINTNSIFLKKAKKDALTAVTIGGHTPQDAQEIKAVLTYFELLDMRKSLGQLWDGLLATYGAPKFAELGDDPERACYQQKNDIEFWLNWSGKTRSRICRLGPDAGLGKSLIQPLENVASMTDAKARFMLSHLNDNLIPAVNLLQLIEKLHYVTKEKKNTCRFLKQYSQSDACKAILDAAENESVEDYEEAITRLRTLLAKKDVQNERDSLLKKIEVVAPEWAEAIRKRNGIHGEFRAPSGMRIAWKAAQLSAQVELITKTPLFEAENQVYQLTQRYRRQTEEYACSLAWYYLQQRIEANPQLRQVLNGWKQTVVKIGKGTGKRAAELRTEARKLMVMCQKAVPAWIMPVSNVMNTIDPETTKFDVIIIDEASQSDITATAILYMGKKIIVVGDDEQVSPSSVGLDMTKMNNLMNILIKDKVPNPHLWDSQTSLYDIAAQVYQPLMLREHFRCVPDIISYSNSLSYQGKIKPLREAGSSPFKTAVVSYRVEGIRTGKSKTNIEEANAITTLIQACIEQPEYSNCTFGVISLVGDDQAKLIQKKLAEKILLTDYEKHRILCGNASNFQGDERDIIFLSMVDSNRTEGPLPRASGEGANANGRAMKQRYNVAVSRARDQLWIVHSLDYTADLQPGDMRRGLLEYANNPRAHEQIARRIETEADSPFETEIATALVSHGYHIVQQWQVGAYYIDMVAICGNSKVAIECDGERWHSGEEKIREDMERQAILERLGWRFIRIRGSEYFRNRSGTISRVIQDLNQLGIVPESFVEDYNGEYNSDALLERVKERAAVLLAENECDERSEDAYAG